MRNVTDVERGYSLAQAKLKMMNVEQRVRFDIIYAEWVKKQASRNSQQEEIRQKEEEERKRKEAEELKRLQEEEERLRNKNINDLPFAEMPEGP
jgi:phosphosulfolactate phosphohydrolase-like enzyme